MCMVISGTAVCGRDDITDMNALQFINFASELSILHAIYQFIQFRSFSISIEYVPSTPFFHKFDSSSQLFNLCADLLKNDWITNDSATEHYWLLYFGMKEKYNPFLSDKQTYIFDWSIYSYMTFNTVYFSLLVARWCSTIKITHSFLLHFSWEIQDRNRIKSEENRRYLLFFC